MQFHLGPAGNLQALPIVEHTERVVATRTQPGGMLVSLDGTPTKYVLGRRRGRWVIPWVYLDPDQYALLSALQAGLLGSPLRLIDPERPNLAHPRLATGGSEEQSTDGWLATSGTLGWVAVTDPPPGVLVNGAISWVRPTTAAGDLAPGRTGHAYRAPVLGGQQMRLSQWVRATSGSFTAAFGTDHFNTAGSVTTVVGSAATVSSAWTELSTVWTPTTGRVEAAPVLRIASGQPAGTVQATGVQIVYGPAARPWRDGGGAPVVLIPPDGLTEDRPWSGETDTTLTLVEV